MPKPEDVRPELSDAELDRLLARRFAAIHRALDSDSTSGVYAVYFRYKGGGYWQGVVKRLRSDGGGYEVCFGRGSTFVKAFKDINAAVSNLSWREDKPWRPGDRD
jgi:hypothetical protein